MVSSWSGEIAIIWTILNRFLVFTWRHQILKFKTARPTELLPSFKERLPKYISFHNFLAQSHASFCFLYLQIVTSHFTTLLYCMVAYLYYKVDKSSIPKNVAPFVYIYQLRYILCRKLRFYPLLLYSFVWNSSSGGMNSWLYFVSLCNQQVTCCLNTDNRRCLTR